MIDVATFRGQQCHCEPGLPFHLVHSEGLREGCDVVVDWQSNVAHPRRKQVPVETLAAVAPQIAAGASVHVKSDRLDAFVASVLPLIRQPIVLVTGDSDMSVVVRHRALLDDWRIHHWFAQNADLQTPHARLTPIPIGVDNPVFTKLEKRLGFFLTMLLGKTPFDVSAKKNDMGQQSRLLAARTGLPPMSERPLAVLCTFHQNQKLRRPNLATIPPREEAWRDLHDNTNCHFVTSRLRQADYWQRHAKFAFEASPAGNGLDCFRTWECLVLGTIPIVKTSPLDRLFESHGLPVVIVESWRQITAENLARWRAERVHAFGDPLLPRLTNDFWLDLIRGAQRDARQLWARRSQASSESIDGFVDGVSAAS